MSNKNDWTDRLPELLEGYTEAEPEGLWDAVQAGIEPKKRRVAAAWWYSGGALFAAAAIVAVVLLWPVRPSADVSLVPGDVVAEVTEGDDGQGSSLSSGLSGKPDPSQPSWAPPVTATGGYDLQIDSALPAEDSTSPSSTVTTDTDLQTDSALPETHNEDEVQAGNVQNETEVQTEPETHVVPIERIMPKVRRKPTTRLQAGLTATGYFSQLASTSNTGVGIPLNPGSRLSMMQTKASGGPGTGYSVSSSMLSRNKASTTDANHYQSAKLALTLKLNLDYRWGIETGVVSSTLRSEFNTTAGSSRTVSERNIAYLGIPLFVNYNVFEWKRFSMYLNAGPMYEFTTRTSLETRSYVGSSLTDSNFDYTLYKDSKWSLNASAGLQLRIFDHGALFVQPGVSYHFKDDSALETFYTEHPASYNVTFGYRILFL